MGILADIARYHLLVAVQRWAGPMLAILCAHEGLRAGAQALPQPQFRASWAPPLTEERDATLRIRLAAMKVIAEAVKPELLELVRKVEEHRITVPAAERRLLGMLPPAEELAQEVLARLVDKVEAAKAEECRSKDPPHCRVHGVPLKKPEKAKQKAPKKVPAPAAKSQQRPVQVKKIPEWQVLGLESAAKFPVNKGRLISTKSINRALAMIHRGFTLHSAAIEGDTVKVSDAILNHWRKGKKSNAEIKRRLQVFMEALRTFKYPQEVWLQDDGMRAYYRSFSVGNRQEFISGVVVNKLGLVISYVRTDRASYINGKRDGKLLYKKR